MKEKSRFSWRGLIPQFFILILLPLTVFLLAITFGGLALHRQAMRSLVGQRDERAVKAAAQTLTDQLNQRVVEVHMLASAASGESSPQTLANLLKDDAFLSASFDQGMAFFTPDGQILASTGNKGSWKNLELQQVPGFGEHF